MIGMLLHGSVWFWLTAFVVVSLCFTVLKDFLLARKIQPKGFKWRVFRNEAFLATVGGVGTGFLLGGLTGILHKYGLMAHNSQPANWWTILLEYAAFFFLFDTWFYWFHRLMHWKPVYPWIHQFHHFSLSPNPLTTFSVNPLESLVNGGFLPIFTAAAVLVGLPIHQQSMIFIGPTFIVMGLYVHLGFEFLPSWWNKTWLTKWFITTTFHDQHHRWFNCNYGGVTTIWDYLCGTVRPSYESDFAAIKARSKKASSAPDVAAAGVSAE